MFIRNNYGADYYTGILPATGQINGIQSQFKDLAEVGSKYLVAYTDADNNWLNGLNTCQLTVPARPENPDPVTNVDGNNYHRS